MGESELEVLKTILSNTDSVIVVLFVLVILFLVIAFIPIHANISFDFNAIFTHL
mgnify:CR=1 FL=1